MITALAIVCLVALALASLSLGMVVRVALEVRRLRALVEGGTPLSRGTPPPYLVCRRCCGYGLIAGTPCPDCSLPPTPRP